MANRTASVGALRAERVAGALRGALTGLLADPRLAQVLWSARRLGEAIVGRARATWLRGTRRPEWRWYLAAVVAAVAVGWLVGAFV